MKKLLPNPLSADLHAGWEGQFGRTLRWLARYKALIQHSENLTSQKDYQAPFDFALAFFQNAHSLRDWLIESGAVSAPELNTRLEQYPIWDLCSAISNRSKHFLLTRKAEDGHWSLFRDFDPFTQKTEHILRFRGEKHTVLEAMKLIVVMWEEIFSASGLKVAAPYLGQIK